MQQAKIGSFIRDMRMEQGLTQMQLAEHLGVTDKAVSKWERGIGYPDIELLQPLADVLKVSVAELLAGEQSKPIMPLAETAAADALAYSEAVQKQKKSIDWKLWLFAVLTASCLIATLVCLICDLAVNQRYTWFPLVLASLALGWTVCVLPVIVKRHPVRLALLLLTFWSLPYLALIALLVKQPLVWRISIWVVPLSAAYIWVVYIICQRLKKRKWLAAGLTFVLTAPFTVAINAILDRFIESDGSFHEVFCAVLIGVVCIFVDYVLHQSKQ